MGGGYLSVTIRIRDFILTSVAVCGVLHVSHIFFFAWYWWVNYDFWYGFTVEAGPPEASFAFATGHLSIL